MKLGKIITGEGTPSTTEFLFVIDNSDVKKGQYVEVDSSGQKFFGYVSEITKSNRYFERPESVAEYEKNGSMNDKFPSDSWEYSIASVRLLGCFREGLFIRSFIPPSPGSRVLDADPVMLKKFLGFEDGELMLGDIEHHDVNANVSMTRLFQKHAAILAMSGAGKSYLMSVILEELLDREKEKGRVAVIVVDIHGEYLGFKYDSKYGPVTKVVEGTEITVPLKKISPSNIQEWLPNLSPVQREVLGDAMRSLRREKGKQGDKYYSMAELAEAIDKSEKTSDAKSKMALKRALGSLRASKFITKKNENPNLISDVKPGNLLILDFSTVDDLRKKQILVSLFARRLFKLRKKGLIPPYVLVIEEAHNFAREKAEASEAISRSVIETIAREGRKFGASLCLISQRPVNLSTTALSQCVTPDTLVELNPGNVKEIGKLEDEWPDSRILTYDVEDNKLTSTSISNYIKSNPKETGVETLEISTKETNRKVVATEDHPFWLMNKGWTPLREIQIGDKVAVKPQQATFKDNSKEQFLIGREEISKLLPSTIKREKLFNELEELSLVPLTTKNKKLPILARLIGHIFGDGTLHPPYKNPEGQHILRITFSGREQELNEIQKDLKKLGFSGNWKISKTFRESSCRFQKYGVKKIKGHSICFKTGIVGIWALFRSLGAPLGSKSGNEVRVPKWIMNASLSIKREFLAAYFGSEAQKIRMGEKSAERIMIPFSKYECLSENAEEFCKDILSLLSEFGVKGTMFKRNYTITKNRTKTIQYYIVINRFRKNIINFCKNIGYRYHPGRESQARLVLAYQEMLQKEIERKICLWKECADCSDYKEAKTKFGISTEEAKSLIRTKKMIKLPARETPSFREWVESATVGLSAGLVWETVGSKRRVDVSDVRDISVPKYHSFFANGFLTHNCNTHIILRVTNPNDLDHIQMSSEGIDSRVARSITGLKVGEAIIVGEAVNYPTFVKIRRRKSEKREKGKALHLQAVDFENSKEKKEEGVEAFL